MSSLPVPLSPLHEHGGVGLGHPLNHGEDLAHAGGLADDLLEADPLLVGMGRRLTLPGQIPEEGGAADHDLVLGQIDGLEVIVEGAQLERRAGHWPDRCPGDDDHLGEGSDREDLIEGLEPFLGSIGIRGQPKVQAHHRGLDLRQQGEGLRSVFGQGDGVVLLQGILQLCPDALVVVHHHQLRLGHPSAPLLPSAEAPRKLGQERPEKLSLLTNHLCRTSAGGGAAEATRISAPSARRCTMRFHMSRAR